MNKMDELCLLYVRIISEQALGDDSQDTDNQRTLIHDQIMANWEGPAGTRKEIGRRAIERGFNLIREQRG